MLTNKVNGKMQNRSNMRIFCEITADKLTKKFNEFIVKNVISFVDK